MRGLKLDQLSYSNGSSHKARLKAEFASDKLDTTALENGVRIVSFNQGVTTYQVDGIYGHKPVVNCKWKRGHGARPSWNQGGGVLQ